MDSSSDDRSKYRKKLAVLSSTVQHYNIVLGHGVEQRSEISAEDVQRSGVFPWAQLYVSAAHSIYNRRPLSFKDKLQLCELQGKVQRCSESLALIPAKMHSCIKYWEGVVAQQTACIAALQGVVDGTRSALDVPQLPLPTSDVSMHGRYAVTASRV